jgi:hypothetical protein
MNMNRDQVSMETTYFREYGMHHVPSLEGADHIVSFPQWSDTLDALKKHMPHDGHVVTTDYSTIEDWSEIPDQPEVITERIRQAKELTMRTGAVLHLGTPTPAIDPTTGENYWHNSVLTIRRGEVKSVAHKTDLFPAEIEGGMREPLVDERKVYLGTAAMICSELHSYSYSSQNPLVDQQPHKIVALTNFAVPLDPGKAQSAAVERAGGRDAYYRRAMEYAVGNFVMRSLPSVESVIVSDRGQPDLPPLNAVFRRSA